MCKNIYLHWIWINFERVRRQRCRLCRACDWLEAKASSTWKFIRYSYRRSKYTLRTRYARTPCDENKVDFLKNYDANDRVAVREYLTQTHTHSVSVTVFSLLRYRMEHTFYAEKCDDLRVIMLNTGGTFVSRSAAICVIGGNAKGLRRFQPTEERKKNIPRIYAIFYDNIRENNCLWQMLEHLWRGTIGVGCVCIRFFSLSFSLYLIVFASTSARVCVCLWAALKRRSYIEPEPNPELSSYSCQLNCV